MIQAVSAGLSPPSPGLRQNIRPFDVGLMVDKWHWDTFFSEYFGFSLLVSFRHSCVLAADGAVEPTHCEKLCFVSLTILLGPPSYKTCTSLNIGTASWHFAISLLSCLLEWAVVSRAGWVTVQFRGLQSQWFVIYCHIHSHLGLEVDEVTLEEIFLEYFGFLGKVMGKP